MNYKRLILEERERNHVVVTGEHLYKKIEIKKLIIRKLTSCFYSVNFRIDRISIKCN